MLSSQELERLNESDVGRRLVENTDLTGTVRIEPHPVRRIVVDFRLHAGASGAEQRVGIWPDNSLAAIRQRAEQLRPLVGGAAAAQTTRPRVPAVALRNAPVASRTVVSPRPIGALPQDTALTVNETFEHWYREKLTARKDSGESVYRSMHKDVLPLLGEVDIKQVDSARVSEVLQRIIDRGSARQAGCVLADLRQMFRWALQEGWVDDDPTATLRKVELCGAQEPRSRTLSHEEVRELAQRMGSARLARHIRHATWLMLATGARIGEVATARWRDIDIARRTWTIPPRYSHSGKAHVIPLSDFALRHFRDEGVLRRSSEWVFPGRINTEPLSPKALGKQIRDRQRGTQIKGRSAATMELLLNGGAWTPLDLRRTAASLLADLGVPSAVISACLEHGARSTARGAPELEYLLEQRRGAFEKLGHWLDSIERPVETLPRTELAA
jgi:integrase